MRKGRRGIGYVMALALVAALAGCKEDPVGNDPQPPGPPRNFRAVENGAPAPTAELQWNAPEDSSGITGYRIWWRQTGGGAMDSTDVAAPVRTFTREVVEATPYTFSIAARRGTLMSTAVTVQWGGIQPPSPAAALTVQHMGGQTIRLQWTPSPDTDITGYLVAWKNLDVIDSTDIAVAATATMHDIATINPTNRYIFYLYARRNGQLSEPLLGQWNGLPSPPGAPTGLQAAALSASSVSLRWNAPNDSRGITYNVGWRLMSGGTLADSGNSTASATSLVVTGIEPGRAYEFFVRSVRDGNESSPVGITWAGAARYTTEVGNSMTLRMYETQSANGAGLTLDPPNGPRNVGVGASNNDPNSVQLAIYTTAGNNNEFEIGPAYAFTEYKQADKFDRNTFVSDSMYPATSLNTWYSTGSIATRIPANGNVRAFRLPVTQANNGQGFYVRTGATQATYHYARVFIKNVGGRLLQGTAPNRFVELDISYQPTANLPFAQPANMRVVPANVGSYVRRR